MSLLRAIKLEALACVMVKDYAPPDFYMRRLSRWYSRTFATPLHEVEALPMFIVMRAWAEENYEGMEEEELETERLKLIETDEDRRLRLAKDTIANIEDDDWFKEIEAEEQAKIAERERREAGLPVEARTVKTLETNEAPERPTPAMGNIRESSLDVPDREPAFKVDFVDDLFAEDGEEG